jgi:hypothetical protein
VTLWEFLTSPPVLVVLVPCGAAVLACLVWALVEWWLER